jgi:hypothetical protein
MSEKPRIDQDTPPPVEAEGTSPTRPVRTEEDRRARVRRATEKMMDAHDETLRKLAK